MKLSKILEQNDPMNPEVEIPGYGVMDLRQLKINVRRQLQQMLEGVSETDDPGKWRQLHRLVNDGVLQAKLEAIVDAHDNLQQTRRKGGINSRGIEKEHF